MRASQKSAVSSAVNASNAIACKSDPRRHARQFKSELEAHQYYMELERNGAEALICRSDGDNSACVCQLRSAELLF